MNRFLLVASVAFAITSLSCMSSTAVSFKVRDSQTNEDIKDYTVRVEGEKIDKTLKSGEKLKLKRGGWGGGHYTATVQADGYRTENFELKRDYCATCMGAMGPAKIQIVNMNKDVSSSKIPEISNEAETN